MNGKFIGLIYNINIFDNYLTLNKFYPRFLIHYRI
jgi:hypothetical protein